MMRSIGWRERFKLVYQKRKLLLNDNALRTAMGLFDHGEEGDRKTINALMQKRCDLSDAADQIGRWLAHGARPVVVAPTGCGKGLPSGGLPLTPPTKLPQLAEKDALSDEDWPNFNPHSAKETEMLMREEADLWAMSYGFSDAEEMKEWG